MKLQYRIFQVGYNGSFHCPFMLGNVQDKEENPIYDYILFDSPKIAAEYARLYFVRRNNNKYIVVPTFEL